MRVTVYPSGQTISSMPCLVPHSPGGKKAEDRRRRATYQPVAGSCLFVMCRCSVACRLSLLGCALLTHVCIYHPVGVFVCVCGVHVCVLHVIGSLCMSYVRMQVEMLLLKELHHDNIVSLLGAGFLPDGRRFVALVSGE